MCWRCNWVVTSQDTNSTFQFSGSSHLTWKNKLRIHTVYDNDVFGSADGIFQSTIPCRGSYMWKAFGDCSTTDSNTCGLDPHIHTVRAMVATAIFSFFFPFCLTLKTQWCDSPSDIWYSAERWDSQVRVTGEEQRSSTTSNVAKWGN